MLSQPARTEQSPKRLKGQGSLSGCVQMHPLFAREFEIPAFVPDLSKLEVLLVNDCQQKLEQKAECAGTPVARVASCDTAEDRVSAGGGTCPLPRAVI